MKIFKRIGAFTLAFALGVLSFKGADVPDSVSATSKLESMSALELTKDMKVGWNLGNSLDCGNVTSWINNPTVVQFETAWGNPVATKAMIDEIKKAGFNTVRIPVTWDEKIGSSPDYKINSAWMKRVNEVVDYVVDNGMYCIMNLHHENNWVILKQAKESETKAKIAAVWKQIAINFKDYDEHLIFETLNEPRLVGDPSEWNGGTPEARKILNGYNLVAVNTIRATGGNNKLRFIMVPTHAASATTAAVNDLVIPNNDKRCIVSLHMYSPYYFAMDANGTSSWGSESDKNSLKNEVTAVYNKFVKNGIAVVIGECGSINKSNEKARCDLAEYYAKTAASMNIPLIWWDNNVSEANKSETFGIFDRATLKWAFPSIVDALMKGAGGSGTTASPTPSTTTQPGNDSLAITKSVNSWGTGYTMSINIKNTSAKEVKDWALVLKKSDFNISSVWGVTKTEEGDSIILKPISYNSTIGVGETISVGFQGVGFPINNFTYTIK